MKLFHGWMLWLLFILLSGQLDAQFRCVPCNNWCDTLNFSNSGTCPHCNMELEETKEGVLLKDSILIQLQEQLGQGEQLSNTLIHLSDVYGPRLMGTKAYYDALLWAKNQLIEWGISNVEEHSFDRSHRGWELHSFNVEMTYPTYSKIKAYPAAFVKGTSGKVEGEVLYLDHWMNLYDHEGSLTNKIVLLGDTYRPTSNQIQPFTRRFTDKELEEASKKS